MFSLTAGKIKARRDQNTNNYNTDREQYKELSDITHTKWEDTGQFRLTGGWEVVCKLMSNSTQFSYERLC